MREQHTRVRTGAGRKRAAVAGTVILTAMLVTAIIFIYRYEVPYEPPPLEPNAITGVPDVPDNLRYGELDAAGRFTFSIAATMYQEEDGAVKLFLTNHEDNEAYIMCEVVCIESGRTIYRSGLLRPGEYVERLHPLRIIKNEAKRVEVYVYALALEDYISVGQVTLDNILQAN